MPFIDSLNASTMLATGLVVGACVFLQLRMQNPWLAFALCCLLGPVLFLVGEPLFYSPGNFVLLVLPRFPGFVWNTVLVYPKVFLKLLWIPVLVGILWGRRRFLTSLDLT